MKIIARIQSDFTTKFGIPKQSGLVEGLSSAIIFEPEYRDLNALRGLEGFSHIWLIWQFSETVRDDWSPTVKPPRLGGNTHMGVFATRSPYRPNPIGLSCVRLERIGQVPGFGSVLYVSGADLMDKTPIYDIKPYIPCTDSRPDAAGGFSEPAREHVLKVHFPEEWMELIPADKREALLGVLAEDPRPSYHNDPERRYGFEFAGFDIRFKVRDDVLTVCGIVSL